MVILFYKNLNRLFYYMVIDVYISFSSYIQLDLSIASKCEGPTFQKPRHIFIEQLQDDSPGDLHKKEFLPCCSNGIKVFHFYYRHLQMAYSSYLCYSCSINWAELIRCNKPSYDVSKYLYIYQVLLLYEFCKVTFAFDFYSSHFHYYLIAFQRLLLLQCGL